MTQEEIEATLKWVRERYPEQARIVKLEACLRKFLACAADKSLNVWEPIQEAQELLK